MDYISITVLIYIVSEFPIKHMNKLLTFKNRGKNICVQ